MGDGACTNVKTTIVTTKEEGKQPITKVVTETCVCSRYYYSSFGREGPKLFGPKGGNALCGSCGHSIDLHK